MRLRKPSVHVQFSIVLIILASVLYGPALGIFFSLDDFEFLLRASGHESWPEEFRRPISTRFFFTAAWNIFGDNAELYHLVQLILHLATAGMIMKVSRRLNLSPMGGRVAALLFVASPVAFTSLHWISGVAELSMAFFALLAAWFALGDGRASALGALIAFAAALLCKESAILLLPAMALLMPGKRSRRLLLGLGGSAIAVTLLWAGGTFALKAPGDPYETGFGLNLLWNLLTYLAWLARPWDFFPDRTPQFQQGLAFWGLILPAVFALAYWRWTGARRGITLASLFFLLLLLPVLPLLRHSYFYYLYLPLVPIWILTGEGLARLTTSRRWTLIMVLSLFAFSTAWLTPERRHAEIGGGLLEDPVIRYATLAKTAISSMSASKVPASGDLLILVPFLGDTQGLGENLREIAGGVKVQFLPVERALLGGEVLKLFFPEVTSARFAYEIPKGDAWQKQFLWWTYGQGNLAALGYGERGRQVLARLLFEKGKPGLAAGHLEALLKLHPDDPNLLYDVARVALTIGERARAEEILGMLERLALNDDAPASALQAFKDLGLLLREHQQNL